MERAIASSVRDWPEVGRSFAQIARCRKVRNAQEGGDLSTITGNALGITQGPGTVGEAET